MRLIDADELITAFPCGESVRTESVRATINHMPTIEVSEDCISRQQAIDTVYKAYTRDDAMNEIYALPPVAPSVIPKTQIETQNLNENSNWDAIGREELIKALIREKSDYLTAWNDAPTGIVKETCDELDKCIAIVINAPSADRPTWIPCSERLPEEEGEYLVTTKEYAFDSSYYDVRIAYCSPNKKWFRISNCEVVAWMPRPKPWKGEDDYERAIEQVEHDMLYEPMYNSEDGSM